MLVPRRPFLALALLPAVPSVVAPPEPLFEEPVRHWTPGLLCSHCPSDTVLPSCCEPSCRRHRVGGCEAAPSLSSAFWAAPVLLSLGC